MKFIEKILLFYSFFFSLFITITSLPGSLIFFPVPIFFFYSMVKHKETVLTTKNIGLGIILGLGLGILGLYSISTNKNVQNKDNTPIILQKNK